MTDDTIFKPKSEKLMEGADGGYITLHCYPSDDTRKNQLYIQLDAFLFIALAYGIVIDHNGLDIYECYSLPKYDWLKLLKETQKLVRFDTFKQMYEYLQQTKPVLAHDYSYSLANYPDVVWEERKEIDFMIDDLIDWTELVMKDGDKIEILGV